MVLRLFVGSAGLQGNCCNCIPARVGVAALCLFIAVMSSLSLFYLAFRWMIRALEPALGHSGCHIASFGCEYEKPFFQLLDCKNYKGFTLTVNQAFVIIGGVLGSRAGLHGIVQRDSYQLSLFANFLTAVFVIGSISLILDGVYVEVCGTFPNTWWAIVRTLIPGKLDMIKLMGYSPETMPVEELEHVLNLEIVAMNIAIAVILLMVVSYFDYEVHCLAATLEGGPTGLGPAFGIDCAPTATREWHQAVKKMQEGVHEADKDPGDFHPFTNLKNDPESFPFYSHVQQPAVNYVYGAVGDRLDV